MNDPYQNKRLVIRREIDSELVQEQLRAALPAFLAPERFVRVFYSAILANPKLLECSKESLISCMIGTAQYGLEPTLGKAWIIPYKNNDKPGKPLEAQYQIGWRGFVDLAKRSGKVTKVVARTVCQGDDYKVEYGTVDRLFHEPKFASDKALLYYSVFFYFDSDPSFLIMQPDDVEKIRKASKAPNSPAWRDWYEQMGWKSCIKRLAKREELSIEMSQAVHDDDMALIGGPQFDAAALIAPTPTEDIDLNAEIEQELQEETELPATGPVEEKSADPAVTTIADVEPELQAEIQRKGDQVEMFDKVVNTQELGIPETFITDYLFGALENNTLIDNLPDLKAAIMESPGALDNFLEDLAKYAEKQAAKDLEGETAQGLYACHRCKAAIVGPLTTEWVDGEDLIVCPKCASKPPETGAEKGDQDPGKEKAPEMPPAPPEKDDTQALDWKTGLDLRNLEDWQIMNTFANLRTSKDPSLGFKGWIRANPTWQECSDQVRKKIIQKFRTLYKEESLEAFMAELTVDLRSTIQGSPEPPPLPGGQFKAMSSTQSAELRAWITTAKLDQAKLYEWAVHEGHGREFGEAGARITFDGAEFILTNKALTIQGMVAYFKD